ncbi:MAG TPA: type II toxin-antitoxin system RelE/ParE family toxin [Bryobacteraceae bacterium]|jgi:toxin ParE1/3/4|nr:type II toxin-antitoxin system RelE/ParE family toxin [Bryobacteraceae bacterium]
MAYRIKVAPRAQRDLTGIYGSIDADSADAAFTWYCGLRDAIRTLRNNPARCPATPEASDLRHLLYGNKPNIYRVIYRVSEKQKQVQVLHIRHGARRPFQRADLR